MQHMVLNNNVLGKTEVELKYKTVDVFYMGQWVVRRYIPGYGVVVVGDFECSGKRGGVTCVSFEDMYSAAVGLYLTVFRIFVVETASKLGFVIDLREGEVDQAEQVLFANLRRAGSLEAFVFAVLQWCRVIRVFPEEQASVCVAEDEAMAMLLPEYGCTQEDRCFERQCRKDMASMLFVGLTSNDFGRGTSKRSRSGNLNGCLDFMDGLKSLFASDYDIVEDYRLDNKSAEAFYQGIGFSTSVRSGLFFPYQCEDGSVGQRFKYVITASQRERDKFKAFVGQLVIVFDCNIVSKKIVCQFILKGFEKFHSSDISIDFMELSGDEWLVYSFGNLSCVLTKANFMFDNRCVVGFQAKFYTYYDDRFIDGIRYNDIPFIFMIEGDRGYRRNGRMHRYLLSEVEDVEFVLENIHGVYVSKRKLNVVSNDYVIK